MTTDWQTGLQIFTAFVATCGLIATVYFNRKNLMLSIDKESKADLSEKKVVIKNKLRMSRGHGLLQTAAKELRRRHTNTYFITDCFDELTSEEHNQSLGTTEKFLEMMDDCEPGKWPHYYEWREKKYGEKK